MEHSSQRRVESKACPGVVFTILRMTWKRRSILRQQQQPTRDLVRKLQDQAKPLSAEYAAAVAAAKELVQPERDRLVESGMSAEAAANAAPLGVIGFDAAKLRELMDLGETIERMDREELTPAAVRFALVGIDGLVYRDPDLGPDPVPATFDLLLLRGPDELYLEISEAVARELGLLPEEQQNLGSPSTSAGVVDGSEIPGTAGSAAKLVTITGAVAPGSTAPASADVNSTA